jgi:hypothetical protein
MTSDLANSRQRNASHFHRLGRRAYGERCGVRDGIIALLRVLLLRERMGMIWRLGIVCFIVEVTLKLLRQKRALLWLWITDEFMLE